MVMAFTINQAVPGIRSPRCIGCLSDLRHPELHSACLVLANRAYQAALGTCSESCLRCLLGVGLLGLPSIAKHTQQVLLMVFTG